jgi:hypothetical protein
MIFLASSRCTSSRYLSASSAIRESELCLLGDDDISRLDTFVLMHLDTLISLLTKITLLLLSYSFDIVHLSLGSLNLSIFGVRFCFLWGSLFRTEK